MANKLPAIPIDNFNLGGLADSAWSGVKYSLHKFTGFNPHQIPGILRTAQALVKDSGEVVTEFCKATVASVNGHTYYFSAESGKVWMRNGDTGVFQLVYVTTPSLGNPPCLGAYEYQNFIYWATDKRLHRVPTAHAFSDTEWATNAISNWANFTNGDVDFHPMREQNLVLYIGDGNLLAQVDAGTFSPNALDIKDPLRIKSIGRIGTDVLLGTYVSDKVTKTELIRWNTYSGSFQVSNPIDEIGINAFLQTDSFVYVQAGLWGRIYVYDYVNNRLESFKTVPGEYSPTQYTITNPDAVATINGIALFGVSNGLGNPSDQGVFSIGRHSRNYPYIMDMPYPISEREENGEFALSNIEIGSIVVSGFDVFVTWRRMVNGVARVGVDKLDYTLKLNGAYLQTKVMSGNRAMNTNFGKIVAAYASLPEGCGIEVFESKNYGPFLPQAVKPDADRNIVFTDENRLQATTLQIRLKVQTSGNLAPELESSGVDLD